MIKIICSASIGLFSLCLAFPAAAATRYVSLASTTPVFPYDNWTNAATNIQQAVDAALAGDTVIVSNGVYNTGGTVVSGALTNRVAITKSITVRSANGRGVTSIVGYSPQGDDAIRCVYLGTNATLSGFTLTNGATRNLLGHQFTAQSGGGVFCETGAVITNCALNGNSANFIGGGAYDGTLNNCTLSGNGAVYGGGASGGTLNNCTLSRNSANYGGGAYQSTLNNCRLGRNSATYYGGGAIYSTLQNCTVSGNLSYNSGGGASHGTLKNCIVYFNTANADSPNHLNCTITNSCTSPDPGGTGNITSAPLFVATNDFHLSPSSPCINAGNNAYAPGATDLDGKPRILGGTVDMGAYEFASAGTFPFILTLPTRLPNGSFQFGVANVTGASLTVLGSTNVAAPLNAWSNLGAAVETPPASGQFLFTDPQATNNERRFYRVRSP